MVRIKNEHWEVTPEVTCIKLTQGRYSLIYTVDWPKVAGHRWRACRDGNTYYAVSHIRGTDGKRYSLRMHRLINGTPDGLFTDHKNGNGLYNVRDNLRTCTTRENCQNKHTDKSSVFAGVYWKDGKWAAQILVDGVQYYLGSFDVEEIANEQYLAACSALESGTFIPPTYITSSRYHGVFWHKVEKKWQARTTIDGKRNYHGMFRNEIEAAATVANHYRIMGKAPKHRRGKILYVE